MMDVFILLLMGGRIKGEKDEEWVLYWTKSNRGRASASEASITIDNLYSMLLFYSGISKDGHFRKYFLLLVVWKY